MVIPYSGRAFRTREKKINPNATSMLMKGLYSLHKSRQILKSTFKWYKKKGTTLPPHKLAALENDLEKLDKAIIEKNRTEADEYARQIESFSEVHCKKEWSDYFLEFAFALIFALVVATIVRQMWFEPYEIPTGSMRPTFKEQDHVTVTKTAFGLNVPLETKHFYFDPDLVQRTSIVIFSGDNLALRDTDSTYFWILPYKKRYIKRLMGKPGDTVYFYGGRLYAVDRKGNFLTEFLDSPWLKNIEHIPFLRFEGEITTPSPREIIFRLMNLPIGKLSASSQGSLQGEIFNGKEWVKDQPAAQKSPHTQIQTYSDFWGMRNYAMARLLTREELEKYSQADTTDLEKAPLYLELRHTPSLTYPPPLIQPEKGGHAISLQTYVTVIPLQEKHLNALMENMYTARFVVKNGQAQRYSLEESQMATDRPRFPGVADGTYEFYYGKGVKVGWGAITYDLPSDSPLYSRVPSNIQKLFNLGIEFNTVFAPYSKTQLYFPHRYAYFRDGDLYLLGAPILSKDDPVLISFNERELKKEQQSTARRPYIAFKDYGPPLKDGKIDMDFIKTFGLKIPDGQYLVLGDNHAMSADSRVFGFVPEANLQGAPCYIIWPPGTRWGAPPQKPYPLLTLPRLIVWSIALLILIVWYVIHRRNLRTPIFKKIDT